MSLPRYFPSSKGRTQMTVPTAAPPRRVRTQAREAVTLMAFSAATSVGLASALLLLTHLSARG